MAIPKHFTAACWKSFQGDRLNRQLVFILRALHKSAASEAFGITAAGEQAMPERLITPADVGEKTRAMSLKEMPGPSTIANLIEFFWKDGFSRIHEIQVMVYICAFLCFISFCLTYEIISLCFPPTPRSVRILSVSQICHLCVKWHRPLRKSALQSMSFAIVLK